MYLSERINKHAMLLKAINKPIKEILVFNTYNFIIMIKKISTAMKKKNGKFFVHSIYRKIKFPRG